MCNVRTPKIKSVETAVNLFYSKPDLFNDDIRALFECVSDSTITRLKNKARAYMIENDMPSWNATAVNTEAAYKSWGLDIADLERRYKKLKQLNMQSA